MAACGAKLTPVQLLASFLRCAYCSRLLEKPLIQFPELGLYVCITCIRKLDEGFYHQESKGGRRDRLIEQICFGTSVKCSYAAAGCQFTGTTILTVAAHEKICRFFLNPNSDNSGALIGYSTVVEGSTGQSLDELLLAEMNCPVCLTRISPPIKECDNSHRLCHRCFDRLETCPVCRGSKSSSFNAILECIYNQVQVPCKNTDSGCSIRDNIHHVMSHEESCEFNSEPCPMVFNGSCGWHGLRSEIFAHCKTSHYKDLSIGPQCSRVFVCKDPRSCKLLYYDGIFFKYDWMKLNDTLCFSIHYLGPKSEFQYFYELDVSCYHRGSVARIRVTFECYHINDDDLVSSFPYLCFKPRPAVTLGDDCTLTYVLTIIRHD